MGVMRDFQRGQRKQNGCEPSASPRWKTGVSRPASRTLFQMVAAATLGLFAELGPNRFTRLLDALAECEQFHDLTMID